MSQKIEIDCEKIEVGSSSYHPKSLKVVLINPCTTFIQQLDAKDIVLNTDLDELIKAITDIYEDEVIAKLFHVVLRPKG